MCSYQTEKAMAPHSSTLAWRIPWTEEPGRLQSTGLLRVGHDWATSLSLFTFTHWRRKWQPTPVFCLEHLRDGGAWWAAIYGVAQSQTRLNRLSSSSSSILMLSQKPLWSRQGNNPSKIKLWISKLFQDPSGQLVRAPDALRTLFTYQCFNLYKPTSKPPGRRVLVYLPASSSRPLSPWG